MHFESRCEPIRHLEQCYMDIFYDVKDEMSSELCGKCKDADEWSDDCCEDCLFKTEFRMNEGMCENDSWYMDCCQPECDEWENYINQSADGHFATYDAVGTPSSEKSNYINVWPVPSQALRLGSLFRHNESD